MKNIYKILLVGIIICFTLISCEDKNNIKKKDTNTSDKIVITTSIPPLKWITEKIAGDEFSITSVVSSDVSPELFDPTVKTIEDLENSNLYFTFDLFNFEHKLEEAVSNQEKIHNVLGNNITLMEFQESDESSHDHSHESYDPHVWFSLDTVSLIAGNIKSTLTEKFPEKKEIFEKNYSEFIVEINNFKQLVEADIKTKKSKNFIIYHPALSYFAKDYGLIQISIEQEGKEPTAQYLKAVITEIKKDNVKLLLVQPQFPKSSIELISKEITDINIIEFNPLEEDILLNLKKFVESLE